MVLEKQVIPLMQWLATSLPLFLLLLLGIGFIAALAAYLISAVRNGPVEALRRVLAIIGDSLRDLRQMSWQRMAAMARLAFQESLRRNVLVVFAVFAFILLLAAWYLDVESDNPGRLYISFVLKATNFLVILLSIFLSAFQSAERHQEPHDLHRGHQTRSSLGNCLGADLGLLVDGNSDPGADAARSATCL